MTTTPTAGEAEVYGRSESARKHANSDSCHTFLTKTPEQDAIELREEKLKKRKRVWDHKMMKFRKENSK